MKKHMENIKISILVLTFNHEDYIRQTLDSIMMQKINVPYEIIILDDASTDETPKILKEYKKKYPQTITLFLRRKNSCHPTKNGYFLLSKGRGDYFAFIEGDDYWIDELKIQKQYDFLEENQQYSGCMTDLIVVDKEDKRIQEKVYDKKEDHIYTLADFKDLKAPGMSVTYFARNYFNEKSSGIDYSIIYKADKMMGDYSSYMLSLLKGDIYQMDEVTAAYRYVHIEKGSNFNSIQQGNFFKNYIHLRYWIRLENYMRKYIKDFELSPMKNMIIQITSQYSVKSMFSLLVQAKNGKKYLGIYLIYKFLMDSNYLLEEEKKELCLQKDRWIDFKKERRSIVLFGSGAVAEEYINKYAWKGNISFLVDNDENKQNTSFRGFLIKNPSEILKYKDKVVVLVTNKMNENAIVKQLRDMGISKYYCYCSMQTKRLRNIVSKKLLRLIEGNE